MDALSQTTLYLRDSGNMSCIGKRIPAIDQQPPTGYSVSEITRRIVVQLKPKIERLQIVH
jgi:hypothetical protein